MTAHQIIFYCLAALILITGLLSVTCPKVFRSAIFLLFSLIGIAGLYFWMEAEFIAAVQISVYVGGIVVFIIFSIFLTEQAGKETRSIHPVRTVFAVLAALLGMILTYLTVLNYDFVESNEAFDLNIPRIGNAMVATGEGGFSLPFEVVSILLLAAMIGCIVVAMRSSITKPDEKKLTQSITEIDEA